MKVGFRDLLDRMGVVTPMKPYDTQMWEHSANGVTVIAEVRIENTIENVSAALQFIYDEPHGEKQILAEEICHIKAQALPRTDNQYTVIDFMLQGEKFTKVYDWESKSCNFFRACVREIKAGRTPDIEMLIARELTGREVFGGSASGGSEKSPKIKTNQLLYDYKRPGGGF